MSIRNEWEARSFLHSQQTEQCGTCEKWARCLAPQSCRVPESSSRRVSGWISDALCVVFLCSVIGAVATALWKGIA